MTPSAHASCSPEPEVGPILLAYDGSESAATAIAVCPAMTNGLAERLCVHAFP
jgi:hypothetical protein